MLGLLASWLFKAAEVTIRLDGPPPPEREAELRAIMAAFFTAHHGTLRGWDQDRLLATATALPWEQRLFYWEGHAFGCAARRALRLTSEHPLDQYKAPGYRYMLWTGTGFYNGLARAHGLPTVDMKDPRWAAEPDFHAGWPLGLGGESFGLVLRRPDPTEALADAGGDEVKRLGLTMGCGRVLWFHYAWMFDRLVAVLERHAALAQEICVGLGVAMTYTQLAWPERVVASVDSMPELYRPALRRGARLALGAGVQEGEDFALGIRALPEPLRTWLQEGEAVLASIPHTPDFATRLLAGLRETDSHTE